MTGLFALLAALWASPAMAGGAWSPDAGHGYARLFAQRYVSSQYVDATQQVVELDGGHFESDLVGAFGEVGLGHGLSVQALVPYVASRNVVDAPRQVFAYRWLGDVELGPRLGGRVRGVPVSVAVIAKLPGYPTDVVGTTLIPVLGDGQVDVTAWGAVGGSAPVGASQLWGQAELGYRIRTALYPFPPLDPHDPADGVAWRAQLGLTPGFGGWFAVEGSGAHALWPDDRTRQWIAAAVNAAVPVARAGETVVHVEAGASAILWARASGTGVAGQLGASLKR